MVGLQTLDLAIGVRVPASQPQRIKNLLRLRIQILPSALQVISRAANCGVVLVNAVHVYRY